MRHKPIIYRPHAQWTNLLDGFFNRNINDVVGSDYALTVPSVNILEENDQFVVNLAVPGLDKKDFSIKVEDDQLIISASKENEVTDESKGKYTRKEFNYSSFTRSFRLPETVDQNHINGKYENGVLSIAIGKKKEALKEVKTIEIA